MNKLNSLVTVAKNTGAVDNKLLMDVELVTDTFNNMHDDVDEAFIGPIDIGPGPPDWSIDPTYFANWFDNFTFRPLVFVPEYVSSAQKNLQLPPTELEDKSQLFHIKSVVDTYQAKAVQRGADAKMAIDNQGLVTISRKMFTLKW